MSVTIEPAAQVDLSKVRDLLEAAKLPIADIGTSSIEFWVQRVGTAIVGAAGLERFGSAGLLRSVVVDSTRRKHGLGCQLVETIEQAAASSGVRTLFLLTQTAESFFAQRGYRVTDRDSVPDELRDSTEFSSLCPASAVCMAKRIV